MIEKKPAKAARSKGGGADPMDVGLLERIVKLMAANDLNTVDVRDGGKGIALKGGGRRKRVLFRSKVRWWGRFTRRRVRGPRRWWRWGRWWMRRRTCA